MKWHIEKQRLFILLLVGCLLLCACKETDPRTDIVVPSSTNPPVSNTPAPEYDSKKKLSIPIPENAIRDNPYSITTEEMQTMYSLIYEGLLSVDDSGKLSPSLTMSWTVDSNNPCIWILSLRKGVLWHDGSAFTSDDVVFSYDTLEDYLSEDNSSTYYSNAFSKIESISALDTHTVKVKMKSKGLSSLYSLTFPIICKKTWKDSPLNGTGPYSVSSDKETSITLKINKSWWKELPKIESIKFSERLDNETALASYSAGQMNFVPTSSLSAGKYRKDGDTDVIDVKTQNVELLIFNHDNSILKNAQIRKALAYSVSQGKLVSNVYMNKAHACDVPIMPYSWLYDTKSKVIETNIPEANRILDEAGYVDKNDDGIRELKGSKKKLSLVLLVNETTDNTARKNAAEIIKAQMLQCGIEVIVEAESYSISDKDSPYIKRLNTGDFDLALVGVNLGQDCNLAGFFEEDNSLNFGNVKDDELLNMANDIIYAPDEASMRNAAQIFQGAFTENLPFMVLYFRLNSIIYANELKGITSINEPNIMAAEYLWYFE